MDKINHILAMENRSVERMEGVLFVFKYAVNVLLNSDMGDIHKKCASSHQSVNKVTRSLMPTQPSV